VFNAFLVLGFEVVILEALNPFHGLSFQISNAQQPGQGGVFVAQVDLLPI
jgi:hypothetical protein